MTIPATSWDETSPAGADQIALGDNRIREMKAQIREVVDVDHKFDSSGQSADMGKHNKVSLIEAADIGTGADGLPILGAQTIGGKAELVYTDEDDNDIQMTKDGGQFYGAPNAVANMSGIMNLIYPVGSIYCNSSDSTNPATLLGVGTWTAMVDEVLVGKNSTGTFDTLGSVSEGEETHTLITSETPAHTHTVPFGTSTAGSTLPQEGGANDSVSTTRTSSSVGGDGAHNNIQPSYVVYMWRRTA